MEGQGFTSVVFGVEMVVHFSLSLGWGFFTLIGSEPGGGVIFNWRCLEGKGIGTSGRNKVGRRARILRFVK